MTDMSEYQIAEQLTRFLMTPERGTYGSTGKPPLEQYVEVGIKDIARQIAAEVVSAHPGLADAIRTRTQQVISEALRKDNYLNGMIVDAVARTLAQVATERRDDDDVEHAG